MSWQAQTAVNHHSKQANMGLFRLLLYLAECADSTGAIDPAPSQDTLAEFFDCTDRTIRNRINALCDSKELKQTRVGSGPGNPSAYLICLPMPESSGNDSGKGGKMAEINLDIISAFAEFKAEVKAEILALKVEISAVKVEKVETKGGNATGSKVPTNHLDPNQEEELKNPPNPPAEYYLRFCPDWIATEPLLESWGEWVDYQQDRGKPLTAGSAKRQLAEMGKWGVERAIAAIDHSIRQNYTGLVEPKQPSSNGHHKTPVNEEFTADAIKNRLKRRKEETNAVAR